MNFQKLIDLARRRLLLPASVVLLAALAGCGAKGIDSTYGRHPGSSGAKSVNGTGVLSGMFRQAGHKVSSWHRISPKLDRYEVIIWAPDDFDVPGQQQREWLEKWLSDRGGRTLVYIGRDYDATATYWEKMQTGAPAEQAEEIARRRAVAKAAHDASRIVKPADEDAGWFTARRDIRRRNVRTLNGPWSRGVDASKVEIQIEERLQGPKKQRTRALLTSKEDVLVSQVNDIGHEDSQLLLVANGSFLLNLPLVNHEHRKLAAALIDQCADKLPAHQTQLDVVFLETGPGRATVLDVEANDGLTGMEALTVWPLNAVALHLGVLGMILCIALFPIFGRPIEIRDDSRSDLGKHIEALGALLGRTKDRAYAAARLSHYLEKVRRDSGASHIDSA